MIQIYSITQAKQWDDIVMSFENYDVYYLSGYVTTFYINGDGEPRLLYYEEPELRAIYVYMKRITDIEGVYDSITPYGYGGVLFEGDTSIDNLKKFWNAYVEMMKEEHIVDNFVRFHPLLGNAVVTKNISNVVELGRTVAMDLSSPEIIWANITSKNRNMIRKAEKNGVEIHHGRELSLFSDFKRIYDDTMRRDNAEEYYFFNNDFYESIYRDLKDHYEFFYAVLDGRIIAISIMIFANDKLHYHLSASEAEYRNLAPSNLLLYKAALWGYEQGFKSFHLGGGVGSEEDGLYKFKAAFNRNSDYHFSVGKEIFDQEMYDELVMKRKESCHGLLSDNSFFPLYRSV